MIIISFSILSLNLVAYFKIFGIKIIGKIFNLQSRTSITIITIIIIIIIVLTECVFSLIMKYLKTILVSFARFDIYALNPEYY
jgi:hypothetical protein